MEGSLEHAKCSILVDNIKTSNIIINSSCLPDKLKKLKTLIVKFGESVKEIKPPGYQFLIINNVDLISRYLDFFLSSFCTTQDEVKKLAIDIFEMRLLHHKVIITTKSGFKSCWTSYDVYESQNVILYDDGYNRTCGYSFYKFLKHLLNKGIREYFHIIIFRYNNDMCLLHDLMPENVEKFGSKMLYGELLSFKEYLEDDIFKYDSLWQPFNYLLEAVNCLERLPESRITSDIVHKLREIADEYWVVYTDLGLYCIKYYCDFYITYVNKLLVDQENINDRIITSSLRNTLMQLKHAVKHEILDAMKKNNSILDLLSPKCGILLDLLSSVRSNDNCLVFIDVPIIAKCLSRLTQKFFLYNDIDNIKSTFLIGSKINEYTNIQEFILKEEIVKGIIEKFNSKNINIIFVSNVRNELSNITVNCKTIIFKPKTFFSYFQARSRCLGTYWNDSMTILIENKDDYESLKETYINYSFLYSHYLKVLKRRDLEYANVDSKLSSRETGIDIFFENSLENYDKDLRSTLEYKFVKMKLGTNGTNFSESTEAWNTVKRYITSLPQDKFVKLSMRKRILQSEVGYYIIGVYFPINSKVKTVFSLQKIDSKPIINKPDFLLALDVITKLYISGELDSNLLPKKFNFESAPLKITEHCEEAINFPNWRCEPKKNKVGSKKRLTTIPKKYPNCFIDCSPKSQALTFVHFIHLEPLFPVPDKGKELIYEMWKSLSGFGILSSKMLPTVTKFPIYTDLGKLLVSVKSNIFTVILGEDDIEKLWKFHLFIIKDILKITKTFLMYSRKCESDSYILAPLHSVNGANTDMEIDWATIEKSTVLVSNDASPITNVNYEDYMGRIVKPWYRKNFSTMDYIVTGVYWHLNPNSNLSETSELTYAQYYREKYNLDLKDKDQPLLQVFSISEMSVYMQPRSDTMSQRKKHGEIRTDFNEIFIPELCCIQPMPAVYLIKAFALPSVLHRIHYMLLAEELRSHIAASVFPDEKITYNESEYFQNYAELKTELQEFNFDGCITFATEAVKKCTLTSQEINYPISTDVERIDNSMFLHLYSYYKFIDDPHNFIESFIDRDDKLYTILVEPPVLDILNKFETFEQPEQWELITVLTTSGSCDVFSEKELPIWGDALLKYVVSVCLYTICPKLNWKQLLQLLRVAVGKRNLYYCASQIRLGEYLKVHTFSPCNEWLPPGFYVSKVLGDKLLEAQVTAESLYTINIPEKDIQSGEIGFDTMVNVHEDLITYLYEITEKSEFEKPTYATGFLRKQQVYDKTIILAFKSLISLYAKKCGIINCCKLLQYVGVINFETSTLENAFQKRVERTYDLGLYSIEYFIPRYEHAEQKLGYQFRNNTLLLVALTHPSYHKIKTEDSYQQLAFLGESVVDFLITSYICQYCDDKGISKLSAIRYALTNNITYAHFSARLDLHKYAIFNSPVFVKIMMKFLKRYRDTDGLFDKEILYLLEESECGVEEEVEVPSFLGDLFKSVMGAIYIDSDKDLKVVWKIIYSITKDTLDKFCSNVPVDPLMVLRKSSLDYKFGQCNYPDELSVEVSLIFNKNIVYRGSGLNGKQAKRAAAKLLLRDIQKKPKF